MAFSWTALAVVLFPAAARGAIGARPNPMNLHIVPPPLPVIDAAVASVAEAVPTQKTPAKPAKIETLLPREALAAYVTDLRYHCGDQEISFKELLADYHGEAKKRGWPSVSPKALSQALQRHCCKKRQSSRLPDGSRPTIFMIPFKQRRKSA